ncbi:MAG: glycosyltransferase family 2 protein, partial [Nitrospinota bacterium]
MGPADADLKPNGGVRTSFLIPIHMEEAILRASVEEILRAVPDEAKPHELLLVENGSRDRTREIARALAEGVPEVRLAVLDVADYGLALRAGIRQAGGERVGRFKLEFWDLDFGRAAFERLDGHDIVLASKTLQGAKDERPFLRRLITRCFNGLLRRAFGVDTTDTHGLKAFHRAPVLALLPDCRSSRWMFDTELV